jgi:hypothetical protein
MARDDPFRGLRLSEQVPTERLDQQLFEPAPAIESESKPAPDPKSRSIPASVEALPPAISKRVDAGTKPAGNIEQLAGQPMPDATRPKSAAPPDLLKSPVRRSVKFNLSERPFFKMSYLYTEDEVLAVDELRSELSHELDDKVTKNDIVRAALHMLLEDDAANGLRSYLRRKLRAR